MKSTNNSNLPTAYVASHGLLSFTLLTVLFSETLNIALIQVALPQIANELGRNYANSSNIIAFYWLMAGLLALPLGQLGDRHGARTIFLSIFTIWTVAGILGAMSNTFFGILVARTLQGCGAATLSINGLSIFRSIHTADKRLHAMGAWTGTISLGYVFGPSLGGLLLQLVGWRISWGIVSIIGLLALPILWKYIPQQQKTSANRAIRYSSLIPFMFTLGAIILLLNPLRDDGWQTLEFSIILSTFLVSIALFFYIEYHAKYPYIPINIIRNKSFILYILVGVIHAGTLQGLIFVLQGFLQNTQNLTQFCSGIIWMLMSLAITISSYSLGKLGTKYSSKKLVNLGVWIRASVFLVLMILMLPLPPNLSNYLLWIVILSLIIFGVGTGLTTGPLYKLITDQLSENTIGTGLGIYGTFRHICSGIGVTLFSFALSMNLGEIYETRYLNMSAVFLFGFLLIASSVIFLKIHNSKEI